MDTIVLWIFNYLSYHMNAIPYIGDLHSYYFKKRRYVDNGDGESQ